MEDSTEGSALSANKPSWKGLWVNTKPCEQGLHDLNSYSKPTCTNIHFAGFVRYPIVSHNVQIWKATFRGARKRNSMLLLVCHERGGLWRGTIETRGFLMRSGWSSDPRVRQLNGQL